MPDVACSDAELAQRTGDSPGEKLVEEQTDRRTLRRGLVRLLGEHVLGEQLITQGGLESEGRLDLLELEV